MQNQRVLVSGGSDFIGSTLTNRLAADNDVIAVEDTYLGTPTNLDDEVELSKRMRSTTSPPTSACSSASPRSS